jgi:hypothetical protein
MQPREVVVRWAGTRHPWSLDKRSRKNGTPGDAQGGRGEAFPSATWSGLGRRRLHEVQVRLESGSDDIAPCPDSSWTGVAR